MADIKYTYFDLRVKGEAPRFLLAYGGLKYVNERSENFVIFVCEADLYILMLYVCALVYLVEKSVITLTN